MSTTGKILTVLVTLVAVVWILLAATVAQLNRNGTEAVEKLTKSAAKLDADVKTAQHGLQELKDQTYKQQNVTENSLTVAHQRESDKQKALAEQIEATTRVGFQLADAEANLKAAEAHKELRIAEKKAETEEKAKAEAEVEQLKKEREERIAELTALREKFKSTLDENRSMVQRLQKSSNRPTRPAGRLSR
jgi:hypothetical protein